MSRFLTLSIGAAKATLAEYSLSGRSVSLTAYGSADLPQLDADAAASMDATLTPAIHSIMREKGIKPAPLMLSLSGQMVFLRFAKFPASSPDRLEELVHYEIEQNVPFPVDEIVSDHQFLGTTPEGEEAAMIVAAKLDQVTSVTDAVRSAGLKPSVVDVAPMSIYNALMASYPGLDGCNVVLDIGSKTTNLILIEGAKIYNRSISVAGNTITKDIAQAFGCSIEEAEQLKLERGYVSLGGVMEDEDEINDRISKVIRTVLTRLHAEISRSVNFYRSQQGGSAPSRLFLTGGSARLPQLDEFFADTLQIEVLYLDPFQRIAVGPRVDKAALEGDVLSLAESAGLALRAADAAAMKINLMPPELIREAQAMKRIPFLVAGAVAFLAALGVGIFAQSQAADVARAETEAVSARTAKLKSLESKLKGEQDSVRAGMETCDEFAALLWSRPAALLRLRAVRESLVPGMWITEWTPIAPVETKDARGRVTGKGHEGVRVTVRGWSDELAKAEASWADANGGKKSTSAEIVQNKLKGKHMIVPDTVKIVSQKDVKGCLVEFAIRMEFADAPSIVKISEKKGARE
jgi:type IV pilus assembly protein PilM